MKNLKKNWETLLYKKNLNPTLKLSICSLHKTLWKHKICQCKIQHLNSISSLFLYKTSSKLLLHLLRRTKNRYLTPINFPLPPLKEVARIKFSNNNKKLRKLTISKAKRTRIMRFKTLIAFSWTILHQQCHQNLSLSNNNLNRSNNLNKPMETNRSISIKLRINTISIKHSMENKCLKILLLYHNNNINIQAISNLLELIKTSNIRDSQVHLIITIIRTLQVTICNTTLKDNSLTLITTKWYRIIST